MVIERNQAGACARRLTGVVLLGLWVWGCQNGGSGSATPMVGSAPNEPTGPSAAVSTERPDTAAPTSASAAQPAAVSGNTSQAAGAGGVARAGASPEAGAGASATDAASAMSAPGAEAGAAAAGTGAAGAAASGSLPGVTDFKSKGPFTPKREPGPSGYVLFYPQELGRDGTKHPILSWGPGAVETASDFVTMLNHIASHGFVVISFDATPQGQELIKGIDYLLAENMRADSVFYEKLDPTKISAGGHSAGSLATFVIGGDPRLVTTLHISGGTFEPHTDIMNLHAPALFVCGEPGGDGLLVGDVANPNCEIDFMNATVPVFYGITKGASHMTPTEIGDPTIRTHQLAAMVGWLRWQLLADANAQTMFTGPTCTLCADPAWSTAKSKNL